jgi:hypothetical protein
LKVVVYAKGGYLSPFSQKSSALYSPILVYQQEPILRKKEPMNKAAIESYARNLLGQIIGAVMIVGQTSGLGSPLDFGSGEWLLVANALWASLIPTALRWANKKDPAFGRVAEAVAKEAGKKLETAAKAAPKKKK